jgi:cytochrome c oxidase subunit II
MAAWRLIRFKEKIMKRKFKLLTLLAGVLATAAFIVPKAQAQAAPHRIVIVAKRFSYDPGEITLKKGQPVVLVLKSADVAHGLRFRDFNINLKVKAGDTAEVRFTPDRAGDFVGHCSVFCGSGHGSMTLKMHVVD